MSQLSAPNITLETSTKYEKLNLQNGNTLTAYHINHIEDGIVNASNNATVVPTEIFPIRNYGKSIAVFGGSMSTLGLGAGTAQDIWKKYLNCSVTNYGVSGAGFCQGTTIPSQVNKAGVHDIYILWCSSNDYRNNKANGEVTDMPSTMSEITTQAGGINWCFKRIYELNPTAQIYLFTSTRFWTGSNDGGYNPFTENGNTFGLNLQDYVDMQKQCCERFSIPYLDAFNLLGANDYNYTKLLVSDKLHISKLGYEVLGHAQAQFLMNGY